MCERSRGKINLVSAPAAIPEAYSEARQTSKMALFVKKKKVKPV